MQGQIMYLRDVGVRGLRSYLLFFLSISCLPSSTNVVFADPNPAQEISPILIEGSDTSPVERGDATSASQGFLTARDILNRPLLRVGQILESVPGLIATQHSGGGKANQYFLRGFNLDHGTDFRVEVDGAPVNLVTHAHGQGYADMNFVIPELIASMEFLKGTYYAELGDLSSAGAAKISLVEQIASPFVKLESGSFGFARAVTGASYEGSNKAVITAAAEGLLYDGPWDLEEDLAKGNFFLQYARRDSSLGQVRLALSAYRSLWNSPDQIPLRAVDQGLIDRTGSIDTTSGGRSYRYGLTGNYKIEQGDTLHSANLYAFTYGLDLFSNFTYFLEDPNNGDQFRQTDRRFTIGGSYSAEIDSKWLGKESISEFGVQYRSDFIPEVSLERTSQRKTLSTVKSDQVGEHSTGLYIKNTYRPFELLRTELGTRGDLFAFDVDSSIPENSGQRFAGRVSPKFGLTIGPWRQTELYLNGGFGFHSNDARGTTITKDPVTGENVDRVTPLVRSRGAEVGVRFKPLPGATTTLAGWYLDLDSELVFVGDAGTTEPSRASRRHGLELTNSYRITNWIEVDLQAAYTQAVFTGDDPGGNEIPGALPTVVSSGLSLGVSDGPFADLRLRYFGKRPLIEDNSARSQPATLLSARTGYRWEKFELFVEGFNLLDRRDNDIDYFYTSRLPGESRDGVSDIHFHPLEPFALRAGVVVTF
jgi:hypothetical protein